MGRTPPRDLVRFSPFGFSLAVAAVITLVAAGFSAGYLWGVRSERARAEAAGSATVILPPLELPPQTSLAASSPAASTDVTFYSELAGEPKKLPASVRPKTPQQPSSSRKAASQGTATAPRMEPPAGEPSTSESTVHPSEESVPSAKLKGLMVQVASYPDPSQAQRMKSSLEREGYRCEVQEADLGPRGRWYRVRLGPFQDEAQARRALLRLEKERSLKGYIVPP